MIVYAVLVGESVCRMFPAEILPGLLLASVFSVGIVLMATLRRDFVFARQPTAPEIERPTGFQMAGKFILILALMGLVPGGLKTGFLIPTEAGAVGAAGALIIALARRSLNSRSFGASVVETVRITVSVLLLIMAATFFSWRPAMSGLPRAASSSKAVLAAVLEHLPAGINSTAAGIGALPHHNADQDILAFIALQLEVPCGRCAQRKTER